MTLKPRATHTAEAGDPWLRIVWITVPNPWTDTVREVSNGCRDHTGQSIRTNVDQRTNQRQDADSNVPIVDVIHPVDLRNKRLNPPRA